MPNGPDGTQNPVFKLLKLTKSADQSAAEKTNISIGAFWINEGLRKAIIEYRKVRPDVRFTVVDYNETIDYSKPTAYEDAITRINADILAGKMPRCPGWSASCRGNNTPARACWWTSVP